MYDLGRGLGEQGCFHNPEDEDEDEDFFPLEPRGVPSPGMFYLTHFSSDLILVKVYIALTISFTFSWPVFHELEHIAVPLH